MATTHRLSCLSVFAFVFGRSACCGSECLSTACTALALRPCWAAVGRYRCRASSAFASCEASRSRSPASSASSFVALAVASSPRSCPLIAALTRFVPGLDVDRRSGCYSRKSRRSKPCCSGRTASCFGSGSAGAAVSRTCQRPLASGTAAGRTCS